MGSAGESRIRSQNVRHDPGGDRGVSEGYLLVVHAPGGQTYDVVLSEARALVGRDASCHVPLPSTFVSRRHALLERRADGYCISDVGSTNGTLVNGQLIVGSRPLEHGDRIALADVTIEYLAGDLDSQTRTRILRSSAESPIVCDTSSREVRVAGELLKSRLSRQEFDLLALLVAVPGRIRTREELGKAIWGEGNYDLNMLHRLAHRLRGKLGSHGDLIDNIAGAGYRIRVASADEALREPKR